MAPRKVRPLPEPQSPGTFPWGRGSLQARFEATDPRDHPGLSVGPEFDDKHPGKGPTKERHGEKRGRPHKDKTEASVVQPQGPLVVTGSCKRQDRASPQPLRGAGPADTWI